MTAGKVRGKRTDAGTGTAPELGSSASKLSKRELLTQLTTESPVALSSRVTATSTAEDLPIPTRGEPIREEVTSSVGNLGDVREAEPPAAPQHWPDFAWRLANSEFDSLPLAILLLSAVGGIFWLMHTDNSANRLNDVSGYLWFFLKTVTFIAIVCFIGVFMSFNLKRTPPDAKLRFSFAFFICFMVALFASVVGLVVLSVIDGHLTWTPKNRPAEAVTKGIE